MTCGIYKIETKCPIAKKAGNAIYIGQSKNIEVRWKTHRKKYPESQYDYEVLLECDVQYLNFFEKAFISGYDSHRCGLNKTIGGTEIKNTHPDKETRKKMSKSATGKKQSEETILRKIEANIGKKRSDETKAKMRASKQYINEEFRAKMSKATKGKKKSEEHRAKIAALQTGRKFSRSKVKCPHCLKTGGSNLMKRYHFDNCKSKPKDVL